MSEVNSTEAVNRRFAARGTYYRWLTQQHGYIPMLELQEDNQDPISLRKIFIPLRLDKKDRDESEVAVPTRDPSSSFKNETKDNLLGRDAFEEILANDFLVVSGRPGAGKTTLIKALINELCAGFPSDFRSKAHEKYGAIFTLPIILRDLPALDDIVCFDSLMDQWWVLQKKLNKKAFEKDSDTNKRQFSELLDVESLRESLQVEKLTQLILFDGIDEVGNVFTRQKIYNLARQASERGHIVIITGRPSGLEDLKQELLNTKEESQRDLFETKKTSKDQQQLPLRVIKEKWLYIQPLTKPQIESFIDKWYKLDPTWVSKLGTHPKEFLDALGDPERSHLLPLARRPIFLSLMAIVHCTKNEMPHGRAELYKTIVDVYLTRQRKHRRLKETTKGRPMPQWDSHEPRTALGYIAWRSMHRGGQKKNDDRRILWNKEDLRQELVDAFSELKFNEIKNEDANHLIDYYLDPAGLLVEPIDGQIQFSHLSFQEYLCAEYLQGRLTGRKIKKIWKSEVLDHLGRPGWDEVALLLMTVHADRTQSRGHFELMSYLDISDSNQADLLFRSLLGKELPIQDIDRKQWLCVLIMAALIHPESGRINELRQWSHLKITGEKNIAGLIFLKTQEERWDCLVKKTTNDQDFLEEHFDDEEAFDDSYKSAKNKFLLISMESPNKISHFLYTVLNLAIKAEWGVNNECKLINSGEIAEPLNKFLGLHKNELMLWNKDKGKWSGHPLLFCLETLFELDGKIESLLWDKTPISVFVLIGESIRLPSVLSSINSCRRNEPPKRVKLGLILYEFQLLLNMATLDESYMHEESHKQDLSDHIFTYSSSITKLVNRMERQLWRELIASAEQQSRLRYSKNYKHIPKLLTKKSFKTHLLPYLGLIGSIVQHVLPAPAQALLKALREEAPEYIHSESNIVSNSKTTHAFLALIGLSNSLNSWSWFREHENRSGKSSRFNKLPLPRQFGIFDDKAVPHNIQKRERFVALKKWVSSDKNILEFAFPDGLEKSEQRILLDDLRDLRGQEWSPFSFLDTILESWPENIPEQNWSEENRYSDMMDSCQHVLDQLRNTGTDSD